MTNEIQGGFRNLARYVEEFESDPEKAARVRAKKEEVDTFLEQEGLTRISNPWTKLDDLRRERAYASEIKYMNHLSAVAEEALRVEDGEFVHSTRNSVMRALKAKLAEGSDTRLAQYSDRTLAHQVYIAGTNLIWPALRVGRDSTISLEEVVARSETSEYIIPYQGWRQTIRYAAEVLPEGTRLLDLANFLQDFSKFGRHKSVQHRIDAVQGKHAA